MTELDEPVRDYIARIARGGTIQDDRQLSLFPPPRVIAFWSPAPQSGKSTARRIVSSFLGAGGWTHSSIPFAGPLRRIIANFLDTLGVPADVILARVHRGIDKELPIPGVGKSFVELAIMFGTTVGREWLGQDVWVDTWRRNVDVARNDIGVDFVLTDDCRFENERDAVRAAGGVLIGIRRPGAEVSEQRAKAEGRLSWGDMDAVIDNDGSREFFEHNVIETARRLGVPV